jgi:hypothetical protein
MLGTGGVYARALGDIQILESQAGGLCDVGRRILTQLDFRLPIYITPLFSFAAAASAPDAMWFFSVAASGGIT